MHFNVGAASRKMMMELYRGNMHIDASELSKKMMMDHLSSTNDICILHGMCDYVGKIKHDDLEN